MNIANLTRRCKERDLDVVSRLMSDVLVINSDSVTETSRELERCGECRIDTSGRYSLKIIVQGFQSGFHNLGSCSNQ